MPHHLNPRPKMKKPHFGIALVLLVIIQLVAFQKNAFSGGDIFAGFIQVGGTWYHTGGVNDGRNNPSGSAIAATRTAFSSASFGTKTFGSFTITGFQNHGWTSPGSSVPSGGANYKVWKSGDSEPVYTNFFNDTSVTYYSGGDYVFDVTGQSTAIIGSTFQNGATYNFKIQSYVDQTGDGAGTKFYATDTTFVVNGARELYNSGSDTTQSAAYNTSAAGGIVKQGTGKLTLAVDNSNASTGQKGPIYIDAGTIAVNPSASVTGDNVLGTAAVDVQLGATSGISTATFSLEKDGLTVARQFTLRGGSSGTKTIRSTTGTTTISGGILAGDSFTIEVSGTKLTLHQIYSTSGSRLVTKTGTGTATFTGTTDNENLRISVDAGTAELDKSSVGVRAVGWNDNIALTVKNNATAILTGTTNDQIWDGSDVSVESGGRFDLNGKIETVRGFHIAGTGISSGGAILNSSATASTLNIAGNTTQSSSLTADASIGGTGDITIGGAAAIAPGSARTLTKVGSNTVTLSQGSARDNVNLLVAVSGGTLSLAKGSNADGTHAAGGFTVNSGGTLRLGASGGFQIWRGATTRTVNSGGAFDMNGFNQTFDNAPSITGTGISSGGALINSNAASDSTLSAGVALGGATSIGGAGNLTISGVISGASHSLTKIGAGRLTLQGTNTFSGGVSINAGNLTITNASGIGSNAVTLSSGTLNLSGSISPSVGALNSSGTSTINLGAGTAALTFSSLGTVAGTLNITGFSSGTRTITFTDASSITEAKLANITVGGAVSGKSGSQIIAASAAGAPTSLAVEAGNGQLTATFVAPASTGGRDITSYKYSTDGGSTWSSSTGSTSTSITIPSLNNGTSYNVQVRAVTAFGDGTATSSVSGTPRTTPTVTTPTKSSIATTSATLGATVTSNGGASLTARGTVWGTAASPAGNQLAEGGTAVSAFTHSRTSLTANTLYYYRGYATNSAGTTYSADDSFTTLPNAPTVGSASSITATGFTAAWTAPASMGPASYTYSLETSTDNSSFSSATTGISSASTSQAVTGLSSGTTYYFRVRAVNAGGNSAYSSGSAAVLTVPAAPGTPTFASVASTSFTVNWTAATGAASYRLDVDDTSDFSSPLAGYNDLTVASTSQAVTGLSVGTTYYARVRAVNATGTSASSSSGTQATTTPGITINATTAVTAADFTTTYGTASAVQTFAIAGTNLVANITATAGTGFQVASDGATYGATATFTNSGGSASGTLSVRLAATAAATGTYTNAAAATMSSTSATSRSVSTDAAGSAISTKGLTLTGLSITDKAYDGTTSATLAGTAAYSGLANSESFAVTGTPSATFTTAAVGSAKALTVSGYTAPSANYSLTQPTLTGNVTTRALTITANSTSKAFNNTLTTPATAQTTFTSSGLQNSETIGSVTLTYAGGYNATDSAGTYNITPSAATAGTFTASNYNISYAVGTLTVTAIAPTVTTPSKASIATTSATLGATVTSNGGAALSARGTVWGTAAAPTGNSLAEGGTTVSAFTHSRTSLTANTLYYYRGYATNSAGTSYSTDDTFTTLPNAPTVGSASSITATGFTAAWTAPASMGPASYTYSLETSTDNSSFSSATTGISSASTSQAVTGLSSGTTYYFRVRAVNAGGNSAYSSGSAAVLTVPAAPGTPTFAPVASTSFTVNWSAATGAASYRLDVDDTSDFSSPLAGYNDLTVASTSQAVTGLSVGTTYYARVRAVNASGTSASSSSGTQATTTPGITINTTTSATAADFTATYGTASTAQTFAIAGSSLVANVTATAGTGFEVASDGATYGATATFTNSGGSASGTLSVRLAATAAAATSYLSATAVTLSSTSATSRTISTDDSGSDVTQKALTITGLSAENKTYDGNSTVSVTGTPAYSGLANGESFSVTGTVTWAFPNATVGNSKSLTRTGDYDAPSTNYTVTQPTLTANITARAITLTASAQSKDYGVTAPTSGTLNTNFTLSAGTLASGESISAATLGYSGSPAGNTASAAVGSYTITPSALTLTGGGASASNYAITYATGTLTVNAASLTITANSTSKVYNNALTNPAAGATAFTSSGLQNSETIGSVTLTYSGGYNATDSAGTFDITPSAATAGTFTASNYAITYTAGTLTVTAIAPTVTTGSAGTPTTSSVAITSSNVTSGGGASVTARGIAYGTSATPTIANSTTSNGTGTGSFDATLGGLTGGTTYYARAYATNSAGTSYGSQISFTTEADVPAKVSLSRADTPTAGGFTVKWTDVANETGYHLNYSTNSTFASSVNEVTDITANATSSAISGLTPGTTYYVRVRGVSAGGNGTWSDTQVNQLQSLTAGSTKYLSVAGNPGGSGNYTIGDIFGSSNAAGLVGHATDSGATTILLLSANGTTANTIFFDTDVNQWREGITNMADTVVGEGKAFMLKNNSGSTDFFLLVGSPREGAPPVVPLNSAGTYTLVTTGRTTTTPIASLNLNPGSDAGDFKADADVKKADRVVVVDDATGRTDSYYYHPTHGWLNGYRSASGINIPAGKGFFIKKANDSTFDDWTMPAE